MGKVSGELLHLIRKQIDNYGIVVWYDPERAYSRLVESLQLPDTQVLRFDGSFFQLRETLEPHLEWIDERGTFKCDPEIPPRLLIYVPMNRSDTHDALVEAERAGVVMEPGAGHWMRNTRLKVLAERVFRQIAPEKVSEVAAGVEAGQLNLEDLDRLADHSGTFDRLTLVFGTSETAQVVLEFLASERYDQEIIDKGALDQFCQLVERELSLPLAATHPVDQVRQQLVRSLLLADLAIGLERYGQLPDSLGAVPRPDDQQRRQRIVSLCRNWRNRLDLRDAYVEAANTVERAAHVARLDLPAELLRDVETFACLEGILLDFAETQALQGQFQSAHDLAAKRRTGFWSLVDGETQLRWTILETASALLLVAQRIREELKAAGRDVAALVQRYTQGTAEEGGERVPWSLLDRYQRHLELRYAMLEQDLSGAHNRLAAVVRKARQAYFDVAEQGAEQFGEALEKVGFQPAGVLAQRNVFQRCVHPLLGNGKTAYVLVDALRYEMAEELIAGLREGFDVQLRPALAQLPSITEVGMAALLPGADKGMELVDAGGGRVAVRIGRALLKDRSSRIRHFQQAIGQQVAVLKLNDLIRVTRRREEIEAAEVILVTSQEIDRRGEEAADEEEARRFMAEVLEKVRRGIRQLARLGVKHVVLTADHGHIFVDDLDDGMKVDAPGGQTIDLHPRVWMGRGGAAHPRYLRTSARQLGLHGDLELAFPRGLACFRTPGGGSGYFHGGISFQEAIVPVAVIHVAAPVVQGRDTASVELTMAKPKVTTRFFSVQATYKVSGLFGEESCRVRVLVKSERKEVGMAAMAAYGFEEGTQEIVLQRDRPNAITMMLTEEMRQGALSVHVVDATSQVELASLTSIPVEISI